jgi:hypothetical protein
MGFWRWDERSYYLDLPTQSHSIYIQMVSQQQHDDGDCICVCVWLLFPWGVWKGRYFFVCVEKGDTVLKLRELCIHHSALQVDTTLLYFAR